MGEIAKEISVGDLTIKIHYDDSAESPREDENLGTMWIPRTNRYITGDTNAGNEFSFELTDFATVQKLFAAIEREKPGTVVLCVNQYSHSGTTVWASRGPERSAFDSAGWDSGMAGIIYATPEKIRSQMEVNRVSAKLRERIYDYLEGEVKVYDQFITGDVFGYVVEDQNEDDLGSCWGFYGMEDVEREAKAVADYHIGKRKIEADMWAKEHIDTMEIEYIAA